VTNVVRDRAWIEREYNQEKWPVIADEAAKIIASGESSLQRAVMQLEMVRRSASRLAVAEDAPMEIVSYGEATQLPRHLAQEGYYLYQAQQMRAACQEDTAYIVELGSGLGLNLFRAWLSGGPRGAAYIACELTEAGRRCTDILAALEPHMDCRSLAYDFTNPDYSGLPENASHAVVFSSQAIEQIPRLDPAALTGILDRADQVSGVHFEPIGWQIPKGRGGVDRDGSYADKHDYSRNFWSVLEGLESEGRITIDRVDVDFFAVVRENPVTLITWRKA
jgi:hypothetical protein